MSRHAPMRARTSKASRQVGQGVRVFTSSHAEREHGQPSQGVGGRLALGVPSSSASARHCCAVAGDDECGRSAGGSVCDGLDLRHTAFGVSDDGLR